MSILKLIYYLGIIHLIFGFVWKWIVAFPISIVFISLKIDKGIYIIKLIGAYFLVSLTVIIALRVNNDSGIFLTIFNYLIGGFILFISFISNAYNAKKQGEYDDVNPIYEMLITIASLILYVTIIFIPSLAYNIITDKFFELTKWILSIKLIGWLVRFGGILFLLNMLFYGFTSLGLLFASVGSFFSNKKTNEYSKPNILESDDAIEYFNKAKKHAVDNNLIDALENYTTAIEIDNDFALAYLQRGFINFNLDYNQEAIDDFSKAIELKEILLEYDFGSLNLEQAYWKRGNANFFLKNYQETINDYSEVINLNGKLIDKAYLERGYVKTLIDEFHDAIADYDITIELNSDNAIAYYNRGVAKSKIQEHESAIQDFNKAIVLDEHDIDSYCKRAGAKSNIGNYKSAIQDCNKALEINKDYALAYFIRGIANMNLGNSDDACLDWKKSKSLGNSDAGEMIRNYCN